MSFAKTYQVSITLIATGWERRSQSSKIGSLRISTNNLSIEQVVKLKEKATKGEWAMPFLKK